MANIVDKIKDTAKKKIYNEVRSTYLKKSICNIGRIVETDDKIICYVEQRALDKYDDGDMATYYSGMQSIVDKLISVYWGVEAVGYDLYGCITATFKSPLTAEEETEFKDWLCGQNSDGFGEGFEQYEIKVDDGYLTVSFWNPGDGYFIDNEDEFRERIKKHG